MRSFHRRITTLTLLALVTCPAASAFAWWDTGHQAITQGALTHLPQPLAALFAPNAAQLVLQAGVEPPSTHYINWEDYPDFSNTPAFFANFPKTFSAAAAKYGSVFVTARGMGPWNAESYLTNLTTLMQNAHTAQDWQNLVVTAAALAHYIEDLHQPLHLTSNFDGFFTGNSGIHARYEGSMIERNLAGVAITPNTSAVVHYTAFPTALFADMTTGYQYVDDVLTADTTARLDSGNSTSSDAYYASLWASTGSFTQSQFQSASEMVASAWYTAWVNAGSPTLVPEPASLCLLALASPLLLRRRR